jgi:hypothetical protein
LDNGPVTGLPFHQWDLGNCKRGDIWRVDLTSGANVFLVDSANFTKFKNGRDFNHYGGGGLMTRTPHDFVIPRGGRWYIVAHSRGLRNQARVSVTNIPPIRPMAPARHQHVDLASIAESAAHYGGDDAPPISPAQKEYDVFVSHASEDKDAIVRPLAEALQAEGLSVWYDEFALRIGASLRRSIDAGLANSRFGVVVLSSAFFGKGWANYELDGLVTRQVAEGSDQLILPLWHNVTKDEVVRYSPSLADKVALRTADMTVREIADEIAEVVRGV